MTVAKVFEAKQPGEDLDYDLSFTNWLADRGDTAAAIDDVFVTVLSEPTGAAGVPLTLLGQPQLLGGVVRVFVTGGKPGGRYKITARIATANVPPRKPELDIIIPVRER